LVRTLPRQSLESYTVTAAPIFPTLSPVFFVSCRAFPHLACIRVDLTAVLTLTTV
jgi:hypothetical protein